MTRRLAAILSLDAVGFTAGMAAAPQATLAAVNALLPGAGRVTVLLDGTASDHALPDPFAEAAEAVGGDALTAPMPGLIKIVAAAPGDAVSAGKTLLVMEAMKMEHRLTAPRDGIVEAVLCTEGAQVAEGAVLLRLAPLAD